MVFPNRSANRKGRRRGGAAAELAILAPVLVFIVLAGIDFCRLFFHYTTITNAARNGALWLSDPLAPTQSPYSSLLAAVQADANNLNPALSSSNVSSTSPSGGEVSVTVQYPFTMMTTYLGFSSVTLSRTVKMGVAPTVP